MLARGALGNPWLFEEVLGPPRRAARARRGARRARLGDRRAPASTSASQRAGRYLRRFYPWYVERLGLLARAGARALAGALVQAAVVRGGARAARRGPCRAARLTRSLYCAAAVATSQRGSHAEGRHPHPRGTREAPVGARLPLHREAPRGRRADQGGPRVRRHRRERRIRRRQERAGDARGADRDRRREAAHGDGDRGRRRSRPTSSPSARSSTSRTRRPASRRATRSSARPRPSRPRTSSPTSRRSAARCSGTAATRSSRCRCRAGRRASSRSPRSTSASNRCSRLEPPAAARPLRADGGDVAWASCAAPRASRDRAAVGSSLRAMSGESEELSELLAARRAKLERLRAEGVEPFPHEFAGRRADRGGAGGARGARGGRGDRRSRTASPGGIAARREAGARRSSTSSTARAASSCMPRVDELGEEGFERLVGLDLGDLIGVDGVAIRTRRGELSLRVTAFTLLAKSLRPPPDKHHGLTDVETRFRRRELDLIANEETRELFVARARIIAAVRRALDDDGFIEVETPMLQPIYGGARGAAVRHPPQRARPRPLPADRDGALPQARDRRRPRARLRARQGLPQRGPLAQAQPRVHDGRVVRGLRRLRGRRAAARGGRRRPPPRRVAGAGDRLQPRRGGASR